MAVKLTTPIHILTPHYTPDAQSFHSNRPKNVLSIHAYVEFRHGSSAWVNRAQYSKAEVLFRIRKPPRLRLDERMQIYCDEQVFEIDSIEPVGRYLEILAHRINKEGGNARG